jgi:hypothetical protein
MADPGKCRQSRNLGREDLGPDLLGLGQDQDLTWDQGQDQDLPWDQEQRRHRSRRHHRTTTNAIRHSHLGCRLGQERRDQERQDQERPDQERLGQGQRSQGCKPDQGHSWGLDPGQVLVDQVDLGRKQQCMEGTPELEQGPALEEEEHIPVQEEHTLVREEPE